MSSSRAGTAQRPRRERVREATEKEIRVVARGLLVRDGLAAVTMRAIAAEMGMTSPALYRYYTGHEQVLAAVVVDCFDELIARLEEVEDPDPGRHMVGVSRAFRAWALEHPAEFGLVFAHPMPDLGVEAQDPVEQAGERLARAFGAAFFPLWKAYDFPLPAQEDIEPALWEELRGHEHLLPQLPVGALFVFVGCWARLVGVVSAEVFGQLSWVAEHTEPFFEDVLTDLARRLRVPIEALGVHPQP